MRPDYSSIDKHNQLTNAQASKSFIESMHYSPFEKQVIFDDRLCGFHYPHGNRDVWGVVEDSSQQAAI